MQKKSVSHKLKVAVSDKNLEESNCGRHPNNCTHLVGIDGSKAVKNTSRGIIKIGKAKSKKEIEIFQCHGF